MNKEAKKLVFWLLLVPRVLVAVLYVLLVVVGVSLQALAFFLIGQSGYAKQIVRRAALWTC